jgi:2'-hydroxyisoflavone reductase
MRVLVLGGTAFLGRHVVERALARGDEVTIFNRGRTAPDLFAGDVRTLRGDRGGDLGALGGGSWDAAIDLSGYVASEVRASSQLLAGRVEQLTFVSSISAYASLREEGVDEDAPLATAGEGYGARKAACERAVREAFGEAPRVSLDDSSSTAGSPTGAAHARLVVRPGLIAGPGDATNRFSYWVARMARGGRVLAPGPPARQVQVIDARDLAAWMLDLAARRQGATFNAVGERVTMAELLEACRTDADAEIVWRAEDELLAAGIEPWSQLPLWIPSTAGELAGFLAVDGSRAFAAGLTPRPLAATARDTLAALQRDGEPRPSGRTTRMPGLDPEVEARVIAAG